MVSSDAPTGLASVGAHTAFEKYGELSEGTKGPNVSQRTIIITGASDGIGAEAARRLSSDGETIILVGRSEEKTRAIARELQADFFTADFARLDEVRSLASELQARYPQIDVLANNAGGIFGEGERTVDGFEKTFQVNHLAPFLLTGLLMDTLITSSASVINTSSIAARLYGDIDIEDLNNERNPSANRTYGNSKLANILFTKGLHRRYFDKGVNSVAFHPGVVRTSFASDTTSLLRFLYHTPLRRLVTISPEKGADHLVWLIHGVPGKDWQSGEYYEKQRLAATNRQANDEMLIARFWDRSAEMVGLPASSTTAP